MCKTWVRVRVSLNQLQCRKTFFIKQKDIPTYILCLQMNTYTHLMIEPSPGGILIFATLGFGLVGSDFITDPVTTNARPIWELASIGIAGTLY